jgi:flagellar M-ring protein FliF
MQNRRALLEPLNRVWASLGPFARFGLLAGTGVSVAVIGLVLWWAVRPDYRLLFGGLSPEDAGAIAEKLREAGVPYRLGAGGTAVYVPSHLVHEWRVRLASEGLPGGSKGFELFDDTSLGMTPFLEQVTYLRALQAELARSISQLEPVVAARVHISRPEPSPFVRERKPPTASVVVKLKPGATLSPSAVQGIVALVAGSVEGLEAENVFVLDASGKLLSGKRSMEAATAATALDYKKQMEEYLSQKAEEMLAVLLGPGRAVVKVSAEVDFTQQEQVEETYDPEKRVVASESITSRKETQARPGQGIPGVASNLPAPAGAGGASRQPGTSTAQEETVTNEYLVSRLTRTVKEHAGKLRRLTVAVLVDLPADPSGQNAPAIALQDVERIVKNAVGFQEGRDQITVTAGSLAGARLRSQLEEELASAQQWEQYLALGRSVSLVFAAALVVLAAWLVARRLRGVAAPTPTTAEPPVVQPVLERPERERVLEQLSARVRQDPEAVARVLERWLQEEASV